MSSDFVFRPAGVAVVVTLLGALVLAPAAQAQSRGELLYSTHCIACHTTQIHWRDKKAATDWTSLSFQVRRWQDASGLGWSESDIQDVARYLNESIYRYPPMAEPVTRLDSLVCDSPLGVAAHKQAPFEEPRSRLTHTSTCALLQVNGCKQQFLAACRQ